MIVVRLILTWLIALCALATPALAQEGEGGWWNEEWPYRRAITVDSSPSGVNLSGPIGRTLLLVRLHEGNFTFADSLENGADLRLVDTDNRTPLPFHIERFDATNGIATLWVSVPNLNGGEKRQLWLYFGNKNAPAGSDIAGSYDPDTIAAYHFSENGGQPARDTTANRNNAQNAAPGLNDNGIIARAARFAGQGELVIPASPSLAMPAGAPMTLTSWVKLDRPQGEQAVFTRGPLVVGFADGVPFALIGEQRLQGTAAVRPGEWINLAVVADGQAVRLYVNGVEAANGAAALPALDGPITLGGAPGRPFFGELDETRLAKTARPAAMILATAQAEGTTNRLVGVAETAERQSEGGGTLFFIISKIETVDSIIIGICMLMLAIAIAVMIAKARYIGKAQRGNAAFMRRFREMHEELVSVKSIPEISPAETAYVTGSPLGRIYEEGIDEVEIRRRLYGDRPLTGQAVEAMRAAVDAIVVEENQKLDKWMVLLTIAIAGGPFIGLLGTVMGVMNTFGGVAMAGDVNVNAIAPGIAAALLATIAGLAAAIPSLFGYNYLNTQIAKISDDMRVFVDRLITRLAEMQNEAATAAQTLRAAE
jgi:biopolymer transport protein ExbB